jgi:S-formylglutathione hydrolase FrmB
MKKLFWILLLYAASCSTVHASIDTVRIYSKSMLKEVSCVVITPASYAGAKERFPVVYLLHGARGNFANWVTRGPDMQALADVNQLLIVCPDGNMASWYYDSPIDSSVRYETHLSTEVPVFIDEHYRTIADREHRAISGLSMGGHGALFVALRHPKVFGACGSMSGAFDISMIPKGYGIDKVLGDVKANAGYYKDWSVLNMVDQFPKTAFHIIIDCGAQDFISYMSKALHEKLVKSNIPHDYIERPGRHDWDYWGNAVKYQLLFFKESFKKAGKVT